MFRWTWFAMLSNNYCMDRATKAAISGPDPRAVQRMFGEIAHRYDFLNHFLSASVDKRWRRRAAAKVRELVSAPSPLCLDLCSGTGDLAIELHRMLKQPVVASDFCHPMLIRAHAKVDAIGGAAIVRVVEADALNLPFADASFDAATNAFGLRNLQNPELGLREIRRILRPGGVAVILEFAKPVVPVLRQAFGFYFRHILPRLGAAISGQNFAYRYLPDSVRQFPSQDALAKIMRAAGFSAVDYRNLSAGIAALYWGKVGKN